jgi:hypothetical protein
MKKQTDEQKDREKPGAVAGAGIEKHGYGGTDTKNKDTDPGGKKGI